MKATHTTLSNTRFGTFLGGNILNDIAQGTGMSAITYLVLQNAGLASVSLVQGAPLLVSIFGAPVLGAFADRFSALLAIMNLAWGIDQVIAMKVAEDYLAVPSQWDGHQDPDAGFSPGSRRQTAHWRFRQQLLAHGQVTRSCIGALPSPTVPPVADLISRARAPNPIAVCS